MYVLKFRDGTEEKQHFPNVTAALEFFEARWHGFEFSRTNDGVEIRETNGTPAATITWRDWEFFPGKASHEPKAPR